MSKINCVHQLELEQVISNKGNICKYYQFVDTKRQRNITY